MTPPDPTGDTRTPDPLTHALTPHTSPGRTLHERDHRYNRIDAENCISGKGQRCHALAPILAIERDAALHVTDTACTLCFEPGCTLPGHVSRVHEATHVDKTSQTGGQSRP